MHDASRMQAEAEAEAVLHRVCLPWSEHCCALAIADSCLDSWLTWFCVQACGGCTGSAKCSGLLSLLVRRKEVPWP